MSSESKSIWGRMWPLTGVVPYLAICLSEFISASFFGVDELHEIALLSLVYGFFSVKLALDRIVFASYQSKIRLQRDKPLFMASSILATIVFCGLIGAAMYATAILIAAKGLFGLILHVWMPPIFMIFIVPCLLSWKRKDETDLVLSFDLILTRMGFRVEHTRHP